MGAQLSSLVKVLVISAVGAALIKYGLPYGFGLGAIAPSNGAALAAILLPAIVMAGLLWWRSMSQTS
ncbi:MULTISPECIES: hypothetical protein [Cyanophyceae]|uniref:hypothetical protein n=1 Tax=Cyanophyceae TaxID=3028117 RepID=UPI0002F5DAE6|nr:MULTISPECIES: hypothetical protein [Cyanophyceae]SMH29619.1 hypothetical protein SAMN06272755_0117 [Picosynechococcus sp. OG1]SMQ83744.1 hypothetical protein SAMN06272774_2494 [Synechococcus sp. 7002]